MNELNEEIKLTLNLMQTDIDDGAHGELQYHLMSLLEIKRNELQQRLVERSWGMPDQHEAHRRMAEWVDTFSKVKEDRVPLTADELRSGGWWCADTSNDALKAFLSLGLKYDGVTSWDGSYNACFLYEYGYNLVDRGYKHHASELKQIHRVGNEFYWSEK